ncbi:MAG: UDP-N-acetylmuramoyl-tripeptide--D-alanyl-D-alanine ligase, partial [Bdellovibrionota bacterium]
MKWHLNQIAKWTDAQIISEHQKEFLQLGTDTRKDLTGQVFIALKGVAYDAHHYLDQAVQKGASALIVHELPEKFQHLKSQISILKVKDTLKALQDFAHHYRNTLNTKIIGITGSNGKTTTKEFTAQILGQYKKTHFSEGSFNNHWGVPMTLLSIPQDADFAVIEMGMNHAGEITQLVKIANPDIVVCTMVGTAHLEFFGTQENIAKAKSEIYMESKSETIRIFNQDQDLTFDMMYPVSRKF